MTERITLASKITLLRLCLVPVVTWALSWAWWGIAALVFLIAIATDFLDGYVARMYRETTVLGAVLDAVTDKVLMLSVLFTLLLMPTMPVGMLVVLLGKEVVIFAGALLVVFSVGMRVIAPPLLAKVSMAAEMGLVAWLLYAGWWGVCVPRWAMGVVLCLALGSCVVHARSVLRYYQIG